MDSETEIDRQYADLTMIIRPDKRYGKVFDVLIEFKFVKLKDAGMSADQAKQLSENELRQIPEIAKQIKDGEKQVKEYGEQLEQRYGNLRLQKFVVVALGFERVCFRKLKVQSKKQNITIGFEKLNIFQYLSNPLWKGLSK